MKRLALLLAFGTAAALAEDHSHHHSAPPPGNAQLVVTINPEARVSVVLGAPLPPPPPCGTATELKVEVINNGFVTAPLKAEIVGDDTRFVALHMDSAKLSGTPQDSRVLHLTPRGLDLADVTIAFSIENNIGDLGGRDRVHLLVRCINRR
jgi:diadenosine tetraphosphatase ApaH/serine/threonine PP2A family protein phosphatase